MSETALELVATYGAPALFAVLVAAAAGVPLPGTLLLLAAGSLVSTGDLVLWEVLALGAAGAILGDQIGYLLGRAGGEQILIWLVQLTHGENRIDRARSFLERWGAAAIFFTRWLIGPLGPWVNLSTGSTHYPWLRFVLWDTLGESLWVVLYVSLGRAFSDRIQALAALVGSVGWTLASLLLIGGLAWLLLRHVREAAHEAWTA